ncbi:hypothetical protein [Iodobacter ciconiae]|uniref:Uncharacterized protein n=1 Tax=Iodobacter ciconiae TaxID=2496266 RepID=A0A3S8ZSX6_9NEIS|nr:hypothetical protein [Iodobacter ciconiae]AZN36559.1 hypothetical protein EJO50_08645 [Iodobacter ciconiae]
MMTVFNMDGSIEQESMDILASVNDVFSYYPFPRLQLLTVAESQLVSRSAEFQRRLVLPQR